MLITLAIVLGLLFVVASSGSMPDMKQKKKPSPIPSISIDPYRIPLPQMDHSVKIAMRLPFRIK